MVLGRWTRRSARGVGEGGGSPQEDAGKEPKVSWFGGPHPDSTPFVYLDGHVLAIANDTPVAELAPLGKIGDGGGDDAS